MSIPVTRRFTACMVAMTAVFALLLWVAPGSPAFGYDRYNDGCQSCHGDFTQSGYTSLTTGAAWPSSLHTVHRSSSYMDADCDLCHSSGDNDDPFIGSSDGTAANPGDGCIGCHGGMTAGGSPTGEAVQRHHVYAGVPTCFGSCHTQGDAPQQESVLPVYYGTVDSNVASSCNSDAAASEDWNNDGEGLDNDGDLLVDSADPACQDGFIFHDNFVTGDATAWTLSQRRD